MLAPIQIYTIVLLCFPVHENHENALATSTYFLSEQIIKRIQIFFEFKKRDTGHENTAL